MNKIKKTFYRQIEMAVTVFSFLMFSSGASQAETHFDITTLGLTDSAHTRSSDGYQFNAAQQLNEAGQVTGYARRYSGEIDMGFSAWFYDGSTTAEIGLTGGVHAMSNGFQKNFTNQLNDAGQVVGRAIRYNGATEIGESIWFYNGATTSEIGLVGSGYINSGNGLQSNSVVKLNQAGLVLGKANRYDGAAYTGTTS